MSQLSGAPDAAALREAALTHLGRYASTEASLRRVLDRRIERWARSALAAAADPETTAAQAEAARRAAREVVARLAAAGAVSDEAFAESRVRRLQQAGRSRRAVAAHLAAKGVDPALARTAAAGDPETEFAAALALARRRRIGPFRVAQELDAVGRRRELAVLARAGFSADTAARALATPPDAAEALVIALRRG